MRIHFFLLLLAPLLLSSCEVWNEQQLPYTPFQILDGPASKPQPVRQPALLDLIAAKAPKTIPYEATIAPPRSTRWTLEGRTLVAPEGLVFRLGLTGALKGGQPDDILIWAVGTPSTRSDGELWLYPQTGEPRQVGSFPGFVPAGPGCQHGTRLTRTGPSTVTLDVLATCTSKLLPRSPIRSLAVIAPLRTQPRITSFRIAASTVGETLRFDVDTRDLDNDGRDDITLTVGLKATNSSGGSAAAEAQFRWIDRAAGLSRDTAEPGRSFAELARKTQRAASTKKAHQSVVLQVSAARRLFSTICRASETPRLFDRAGEGLACGDLSSAFESFTRSAITSAVSAARPQDALAALEQHTWFGTSQRARNNKFIAKQLARIERQIATRRVVKLVPLKAIVVSPNLAPHYSPLSFHADGSLLLLTAQGVTRSAPDGRYEYDASLEIDPWQTAVRSIRGERLAGIAYPCDGAEVSFLRSSENGVPLTAIRTNLLAPRPGNCGSLLTPPTPSLGLIGWRGAIPSILIGLSQVGPTVAHPPLGSASSPNGRYTIVATRFGLLVVGNPKPDLWKFEDPSLPLKLQDCVVSNNAQAAACLLQGRAYVVLPDPHSGQ